MIINSPVGRFPFTVASVSLRRRRILLRGRMGTWPATLEATAADVPAVAARLSAGLVAIAVVAALALVGIGVLIGALAL